MDKLPEVFNTLYFAAHYAREVDAYLGTVDSVDLAGARICRDVMNVVENRAGQGLEVCDSVNARRAALFAENRRRSQLRREVAQKDRVALITPTSRETLIASIHSLSPDVYYSAGNCRDFAQAAYVFLVQAARPDVKIDLDIGVVDVLGLISTHLYPNSHRWEEFYVLNGYTFVVEKVGDCDYEEFLRTHIAVPTDFGQKVLFSLPEWSNCIERISARLDRMWKPKGMSIKDYL